jgi:hypothetical protein
VNGMGSSGGDVNGGGSGNGGEAGGGDGGGAAEREEGQDGESGDGGGAGARNGGGSTPLSELLLSDTSIAGHLDDTAVLVTTEQMYASWHVVQLCTSLTLLETSIPRQALGLIKMVTGDPMLRHQLLRGGEGGGEGGRGGGVGGEGRTKGRALALERIAVCSIFAAAKSLSYFVRVRQKGGSKGEMCRGAGTGTGIGVGIGRLARGVGGGG